MEQLDEAIKELQWRILRSVYFNNVSIQKAESYPGLIKFFFELTGGRKRIASDNARRTETAQDHANAIRRINRQAETDYASFELLRRDRVRTLEDLQEVYKQLPLKGSAIPYRG